MFDDISEIISTREEFKNSDNRISILIKKIDDSQLHCGIIYKFKDNIFFIHLCWHHRLKKENNVIKVLSEGYKLIPLKKVSRVLQYTVAMMCNNIWEKCQENQIPYGFLYKDTRFDKKGMINLGNKEHGLTCGTFVLSLFKSGFVNLIDVNNWKEREEDKIWHKEILEELKKPKYHVSSEHIENLEKEIGCFRFRPEEVAVSSTFENKPATFKEITERGIFLKGVL